jgi:hypothetical protein
MGGSAQQQAPQVRAALLLAIEADGTVLIQRREQLADTEWKKVEGLKVAVRAGEPVKLGLRRKERGSAHFQFFVNGAPAGDPVEMNPWRGKSKQQISALFFAAAAPGRKVDAELQHARRVEFLPQ